jgi:hypothetical protein
MPNLGLTIQQQRSKIQLARGGFYAILEYNWMGLASFALYCCNTRLFPDSLMRDSLKMNGSIMGGNTAGRYAMIWYVSPRARALYEMESI